MNTLFEHVKGHFYIHSTNCPIRQQHVYFWDEKKYTSVLIATFSVDCQSLGLSAYKEAVALCDRLNAEYRKEQDNG